MLIQPASNWSTAISANSAQTAVSRTDGSAAANTAASATLADRTSISQAARDLLAAETTAAPGAVKSSAVFDTNKGSVTLDIDEYFQPPANVGGTTGLPPLLMPSASNIQALTDYVSGRMPDFLARNGIPVAPASISYDSHGRLQLPADYPYAEAFEAALADDPVLARSMRTAAALSSVYADMQKSIPFHEEYAAATSATEVAAVVAKYAWLLADNRQSASIALNFSTDGKVTVSTDNKTIVWPTA